MNIQSEIVTLFSNGRGKTNASGMTSGAVCVQRDAVKMNNATKTTAFNIGEILFDSGAYSKAF